MSTVSRALVASLVALGACTPIFVVPPPQTPPLGALSRPVPLVVLPAIDQRPSVEHTGASVTPTFIWATSGAAMSYSSGAKVVGDSDVAWTRNGYPGLPSSASTALSSDLGNVLRAGFQAQVVLDPLVIDPSQLAQLAPSRHYADGAIVVLPVIDHLTEVTPQSSQGFSSSSSQTVGNTTITTTTTFVSSQLGVPAWITMVRLHVFEIRGGAVVRHVVRYAARSGPRAQAYSDALNEAARQVGVVIDREFGDAALPVNAPIPDAPPPSPATMPTILSQRS